MIWIESGKPSKQTYKEHSILAMTKPFGYFFILIMIVLLNL